VYDNILILIVIITFYNKKDFSLKPVPLLHPYASLPEFMTSSFPCPIREAIKKSRHAKPRYRENTSTALI